MSTLSTMVGAYQTLIVSAAGAETDLAAATGFNVGVPSPGGDLDPVDIEDLWSKGRGSSTGANSIVLTCFATANDNDTVTMSLYGIADGGAPEMMASLVWIFGTAIKSSGVRWADTCTVTSTHTSTVAAYDSGNNRICKVKFDASGYRYLYAIAHTTTTGAATIITVPMRPY